MSPFWSFAAKMLRYRGMIVASFVMAGVAALTLGAGLVGIKPILEGLLGKNAGGLPQFARDLNAKVPGWAPGWANIPDSIIQKLPDGPSTAVAWIMGSLCVLTAIGAAGASFKPLTGLLNDVQASAAAAERLAELMKGPTESGHEPSLPKLPRHKHSISFDNVIFTYPTAARPALDGVSLTINHGETVAVVGPNGSGKTTLLALVPRLFDPDMGPEGRRGRVLLDGNDISRFSVRSLRRQIGVVTQETVLFKGTIRHNIAYGAEAATEDAIITAAKRARAHDFITALPKGYDTMVAEQGLTLSGGQRQRLAIARAILRDPSILILDEATSMIDADSEAQIAEALADFAKGRTSLIVAHRLSTVLSADRILVMNQGKIVDAGTHAELLQRCPVYRLIADRQLLPPVA